MKIKILPSANQDIIDGYWFYEKQKEGLGEYFINTIFSDIDSLKIFAGIHPIFFERYYRLLSKRFPFAIYYKLKNKNILVFAVLDCRQNPAWIRDKINQ